MLIKAVQFENFRRFEKSEFCFSPGYNVLTGRNGTGKTTMLEGLYLLSTGKSFITNHLNNCIRFEGDYVFLSADIILKREGYSATPKESNTQFSDEKHYSVRFLFGKNKREVRLNEKKFSGFSPIVGMFPVIFMNYKLSLLVRGGPENRRAFLNHLLIFTDREYYSLLKKYYILLKDRNALLKQGADTGLLKLYSEEILSVGKTIQKKRVDALNVLKPATDEMFYKITGRTAGLTLNYVRSNIEKLTDEETLRKEVQRRRTLYGVHLDEVEILLNGVPAREFSSLGESYSIGFALRFAENKLIEQIKGESPVVLLDDFFSDLDAYHRKNILNIIKNQQVLLTTLELSLIPEDLIPRTAVIVLR